MTKDGKVSVWDWLLIGAALVGLVVDRVVRREPEPMTPPPEHVARLAPPPTKLHRYDIN